MIIKWTKEGKSTKVLSIECECGVKMDKIAAVNVNIIAQTATLANGTIGPHKYRYNVEFNVCPSCAKQVEFSEQIFVDKEKYMKLNEDSNDDIAT